MRKIAVTDSFLTEALLARVADTAAPYGFSVDYFPDRTIPAGREADYEIIFGVCAPETLRAATRLKWFCSSFAGVDHLLSDDIYPHPGVLLSNSSGAFGIAMSEYVLMAILMLLRRMPAYQRSAAQHRWAAFMPTRSVYGSAVTIAGTGDVGSAVARRVKALGARVVRGVHRGSRAVDPAFDQTHAPEALDTLLPQTDILVLALPGTADTANVLSRARIALLPPHAIVVNVGRGSTVDQEALAEALNDGRIAGAALDVFASEPLPPEHPLWDTKNLLITPHISGNMSMDITCERNVALFCEDLVRYAAGKPLARLVNRKQGY